MRPRLLIVHENDSVRHSMHNSLVGEHCEVVSIATASDAFGLIAKEKFDGIVVNLESSDDLYVLMAGIRGFQPGTMIVAVSDSLDPQQLDLYYRLRGNAVTKQRNIKEIVQFLPTHPERDALEIWIGGQRKFS
jgi:CheY-like chemotaxis protein